MKKHTVFIIIIIGIALVIGIWRENQDPTHSEQSAKQFTLMPLTVGTSLPQPQKFPEIALTDMDGKPFTNKQLQARWSFLFFGYTACPSLCPTTLGTMQQISERLRGGVNLQFVFISIDPHRDTPSQLKEYLQQEKYHGTPFMGVTGDKNIIHELAQTLGISISTENITQEEIEHGGAILLINPEGKLTALFTSSEKPYAIAHDFKEIVHHYASAV